MLVGPLDKSTCEIRGGYAKRMETEDSRSLVPRLLTCPAVVLIVHPRGDQSGAVCAELVVQRSDVDPFEGRGGSDDRKLTLSYLVVGGSHLNSRVLKGEFCASYDSGMRTVSLTSHVLYAGALDLGLSGFAGQGIGTYLMNTIVWWAKQFPSDTNVNTITLLSGQAVGANKERRNRFYEQFGIEFAYDDPVARETGKSLPMSVKNLSTLQEWASNVVEQNFAGYARKRNLAWGQAETRALAAEQEVERLRRTLKEERIRLELRHRHSLRRAAVRVAILTAMACVAVAGVAAKTGW